MSIPFQRKIRYDVLRHRYPGDNVQPAAGLAHQAIAYVKKNGEYIEFGTNAGPEKRLAGIVNIISSLSHHNTWSAWARLQLRELAFEMTMLLDHDLFLCEEDDAVTTNELEIAHSHIETLTRAEHYLSGDFIPTACIIAPLNPGRWNDTETEVADTIANLRHNRPPADEPVARRLIYENDGTGDEEGIFDMSDDDEELCRHVSNFPYSQKYMDNYSSLPRPISERDWNLWIQERFAFHHAVTSIEQLQIKDMCTDNCEGCAYCSHQHMVQYTTFFAH